MTDNKRPKQVTFVMVLDEYLPQLTVKKAMETAQRIGSVLSSAHDSKSHVYFNEESKCINSGGEMVQKCLAFFVGSVELSVQNAVAVELEISSYADQLGAPKPTTSILIPNCSVKHLIGKRGAGIKNIEQRAPQTTIGIQSLSEYSHLVESVGTFGRLITITGPLEQRLLVMTSIHSFITNFPKYCASWRGEGGSTVPLERNASTQQVPPPHPRASNVMSSAQPSVLMQSVSISETYSFKVGLLRDDFNVDIYRVLCPQLLDYIRVSVGAYVECFLDPSNDEASVTVVGTVDMVDGALQLIQYAVDTQIVMAGHQPSPRAPSMPMSMSAQNLGLEQLPVPPNMVVQCRARAVSATSTASSMTPETYSEDSDGKPTMHFVQPDPTSPVDFMNCLDSDSGEYSVQKGRISPMGYMPPFVHGHGVPMNYVPVPIMGYPVYY